jgi:hypothetical protein
VLRDKWIVRRTHRPFKWQHRKTANLQRIIKRMSYRLPNRRYWWSLKKFICKVRNRSLERCLPCLRLHHSLILALTKLCHRSELEDGDSDMGLFDTPLNQKILYRILPLTSVGLSQCQKCQMAHEAVVNFQVGTNLLILA